MYSNKENVNILTALLVAHGVRYAVCCPGSRNSPIVHNLNECPDVQCWPVTDERSAAFYALGVAQATEEAVAVCVTSGTALLNVLPAVAEAHYQHVPLVINLRGGHYQQAMVLADVAPYKRGRAVCPLPVCDEQLLKETVLQVGHLRLVKM